ncbi:DUF4822 domain-containing protein [Rhinopithecimicrobium faecis]|uniref:DUF4822 domain-containing protein n=1 Tax=Rhinopithecimicrobium faecis TaxID=2820698 RepID=UPI00336551FE
MKTIKKLSFAFIFTLLGVTLFSCKKNDDNKLELSPSQILSSTPWETTKAVNEKGESISLTNPSVAGSVGFAYFKANGKFTIFSLQDAPRIQGDWTVSADGKTRTLVARNASDKELFTRQVEITVLTSKEFTYRIYPNEDNRNVYFDIVHTPTQHAEPEFVFTPTQILSSTNWETTGATNEKGENVSLSDPNVVGSVGFAYFRPNGTFAIYGLNDVLRIQGDWTVSADGKTRTLVAKNPAGEVLFTRVVDITVLTTKEFTYRLYPNNADRSVYLNIKHTPTDHREP